MHGQQTIKICFALRFRQSAAIR